MSAPSTPLVQLWNGTNRQAIKAASTPAAATDEAAVITVSPNLPAADNSANGQKLPVIPARANAAAPTWTEGNQVPLSTDLAGNLRTRATAPTSATSTVTGVAASATSVTLLAANAARLAATIANDITSATLYVKCGTTASTASGGYTVIIEPGGYWDIPANYTGRVDGIWTAATGFANVDEFT